MPQLTILRAATKNCTAKSINKIFFFKLGLDFNVVIKLIVKITASSFRYVPWLYEEANKEKGKTLMPPRDALVFRPLQESKENNR